MSNKRYRRKPEENRRTPEQVRETLTDINAAFSSGNFTSDHVKQIHDASRDVLRNSVEREATEKREAQADTHGVDAAAEAAQEHFRQRVADAPFPEPVKRLTDDEVLEIMDNLFVKLNHISNNSMYAIDAVNPRDADRAYARDVSERARKPERPVRAHPLVALSNLVLRCSRLMIQVIAITRPHLLASAKAAAKATAANLKQVKESAEKVVSDVQQAAAGAKPAAS